MRGRTHAVIGANMVWIASWLIADFSWNPLLIPIGALGALMPDLDSPESLIKHLRVSLGSRKDRLEVKPFALPSLIFSTLFGHRGVLHSLLATVVVALGAYVLVAKYHTEVPFLTQEFSIVLTLGYASHLVADSCTHHGVRWLWPWDRRFHILPRPMQWSVNSTKGAIIESILSVIFVGTLALWGIQASRFLR